MMGEEGIVSVKSHWGWEVARAGVAALFWKLFPQLYNCLSVRTRCWKYRSVQCEMLGKKKPRSAHLTVTTLWGNFLYIDSTLTWCGENRTICRITLIKISKKLSFSLCILINICPIYMSDKQSQNERWFKAWNVTLIWKPSKPNVTMHVIVDIYVKTCLRIYLFIEI